MDHLTPSKIQRLLKLAEDKTYANREKRTLYDDDKLSSIVAQALQERTMHCESSSGVYDLDKLPDLDEADYSISPSLCNTFNTIEITGRSTDTDASERPFKMTAKPDLGDSKRKSLRNVLEAQTCKLPDLMRHSVGVDLSFRSKGDLTADEVSLITREVGVPPVGAEVSFAPPDFNTSSCSKDLSVGAYFGKKCARIESVLTNTESPDRSYMMPSITEVSQNYTSYDIVKNQTVDNTLDSVPVRQTQLESDTEMQRTQGGQLFKVPDQPVGENSKSIKKIGSKLPTPKASQKSFLGPSAKPADLLLKKLQASYKQITEDSTGEEYSISLSNIADYLGKESEVRVTDILKLNNTHSSTRSVPLRELSVTMLKETRTADTASSAGTVETVVTVDKLKKLSAPQVLITEPKDVEETNVDSERSTKQTTRSKSPSSRSPSTLSTVRDNFTSFKSGDSPLHTSQNNGEGNRSKVPSPNLQYKELDKSVDWQEVLLQKRLKRESIAKDQWAEIAAEPVDGYVGALCPVVIKVTTLTDSWLTATLQFDELPNGGKDLNIELPRLPLLLSPGKSEQFTFFLTAHAQINTTIPFTIKLKDTSIDDEFPQKGYLNVNIKVPMIQAMSSAGVNKLVFPPILEKRSHMKCFIILSDCPVDLQLELRITEGENAFRIKHVQEVNKSDVNRILLEPLTSAQAVGKCKSVNKQLCRLVKGKAIKVVVIFNASKLDVSQMDQDTTIKGKLDVDLLAANCHLKQVELIGVIGFTKLLFQTNQEKIHVSEETTAVKVANCGSIAGLWRAKIESSVPFRVQPDTFELSPKAVQTIKLIYTGQQDYYNEGIIVFEEISTGHKTELHLAGGVKKPKLSYFPIKTNQVSVSWVRAGTKEICLLNCSDVKVQLRCMIIGDGFGMETSKPGGETKICLTFGPQERRNLSLIFSPNTNKPYSAVLKMSHDRDSELCRKIPLFGCESGSHVRWSGLATYGNTALVRSIVHAPIELKLNNKSSAPAFVCATLHFNVHYLSASQNFSLIGARAILGGRAGHRLVVRVDWARVVRRARLGPPAAVASLATLTVFTGAELTRRRILRMIRNPTTGELDKSLLPDNLKSLTDEFDGEDPAIDRMLDGFDEPKTSLDEVIDGLDELIAQIDLPIDFTDDNETIIIADDTVVHYHTLCE